jgi:serine/threonine protein kinase
MERKLDSYTILEEIGKGGMATVYKAVQESLNRHVALKELDLSRLRSEPKALERFRLEAQAAAALDHPNIVTIYDLWEEDGKAYIAMELINGVELKDVLAAAGSLEFMSAVLIAMAVSGALHYAHTRGMVHRDVKPGNIMLSAAGEVRLMDFGIVSVPGDADLTVAGQILGTPAYMAPEQIAGEKLGPGTDVFSLGAVLYEMIAGQKPFTGSSHIALIQAVLNKEPEPLHKLDPRVPESISQAVQKCLEKSPEKRYGSIDEFSTVLEMIMPLDRPDVKTAVKRAGPDDRTTPQAAAFGTSGESAGQAVPFPGKDAGISERKGEAGSLVDDPGTYTHELENSPPAELPPLEPDGEMEDGSGTEPVGGKEDPKPLTLKDLPEPAPAGDTGHFSNKRPSAGSRRGFVWIIPVLLLLAAVGVWRFTGISKPTELIEKVVVPLTDTNARITILVEPAGSVFMDGQAIGDAAPMHQFEAKPGLHSLEIRNPGFDPKKIIVELDPGQEKEIEVKFER